MNLYPNEEIERISKIRETNDKLEEFFNQKREKWNTEISPLFEILKDNFTSEKVYRVFESQSAALSHRQSLNEEISFMLNRRSKEEIKLKKAKQDKFIFYAINTGLKTNYGEKSLLIDAHISENDRSIQLIENYIEFLRATSKNLESLGYTIKNIIDLMSYLNK
jgi:hypothetical protein